MTACSWCGKTGAELFDASPYMSDLCEECDDFLCTRPDLLARPNLPANQFMVGPPITGDTTPMSISSPHFTRAEFTCRCGCGFAAVDKELLDLLEEVRRSFASPVVITSGCRCEAHNQAVGGAPGSYHVKGMAADIQVQGVRPDTVYTYINRMYPDRYGLKLYETWVHLDVRPGKWRAK